MSPGRDHDDLGAVWFLEGESRDRGFFRIPVRPLPFRIGRRSGLDLAIPSPSVSQEHAEIYPVGDSLFLRDLGSTNGTFVNGQRLGQPTELEDGDALQFADQSFRLVVERQEAAQLLGGTLQLSLSDLSRSLAAASGGVRRLIDEVAVTPVFQPIVDLADGSIVAYETLCRGNDPELPSAPGELFALAASHGFERELSRMFRAHALEAAQGISPTTLFFNTHPSELRDPAELLTSLASLARSEGGHRLVLEIHETAVTNLTLMRELKAKLAALGVGLAYDDFGAGQARLLEVVEVPPDYLKFDMSLIRNLDQAGPARRRMLSTLVDLAKGLGIPSIAEGVESSAEAEAAREVGFELAQGFLYGRPRTVEIAVPPTPAG